MSTCKPYDATSSQMGGPSQEAPAATLTYDPATTTATLSSTGDTSSTLANQRGILAWVSGTGAAITGATATGASDNGQSPATTCTTAWRLGSSGSGAALGATAVSFAVTPPTSGTATFGVAWATTYAQLKFKTVAVAAAPPPVTFSGPIIDIYCWDLTNHRGLDGAVLDTNPEAHTVHCLRDIAVCRAGGFAILEKPAGATRWSIKYRLDATGNTNALTVIDSTSTIANLWVTISGTLNADGVTLEGATVAETTPAVSTCDTYTCPAATHRLIAAAATTNCAAAGCNTATCCEVLPTCASYTCTTAGNVPIAAAATTNCAASGCVESTCCTKVKCDSYTCATAGNVRIAAAATTSCAASGCSDATCCTAPNTCSTFTCSFAGEQLVAAAHTTNCPATTGAGGCSDATCCEASMCSAYSCPAASFVPIAAAGTTACDRVAGCTEARCCEALPKCDTYACPAATHRRIAAAATTSCAASGCTASRCCEDLPKCSTHTCATAGSTRIAAAATTSCAATGCSDAACCDAPKITFTGPIIDIYCWDLPDHRGLDNAVLDTNPEEHTVHCLRDVAVCRAGGFAILEKLAGATRWSIKYRLDATGNANALKLIDATSTIANLRVTVSGATLNADGVTLVGATVEEASSAFPLTLKAGLVLDRSLLKAGGAAATTPGDDIEALDFSVTVNRNTWVAVGISKPGATGPAAMTGGGEGSDIIACTGGRVLRYWVTSLSMPTAGVEVPGATCTQQAGSTTMTFRRNVAAASATERALALGSKDTLIWATGLNGATEMTSKHATADRGVTNVDLKDGGATTVTKSASAALWLHLIFMCLSWGALLPWGVAVASRAKVGPALGAHKAAWFKIHVRFQVVGWFLQLLGFAMAIWHVESFAGAAHFSTNNVAHKVIGLVVVLLGTLQPLNAQLRPHPPTGGWGSAKGGKPVGRVLWELAHKGSGHIAVFLGVLNVILGLVATQSLGFDAAAVAIGAVLLVLGAGTCLVFVLFSFCDKTNPFTGCCLRSFGGIDKQEARAGSAEMQHFANSPSTRTKLGSQGGGDKEPESPKPPPRPVSFEEEEQRLPVAQEVRR